MSKRTYSVVKRQLQAFGLEQFEVGIGLPSGKMIIREWDTPTVLRKVSYLSKCNLEGSHIFVRPNGASGFVFLDDLNQMQVKRLSDAGLSPSIVLMSSPQNYQAWVLMSDHAIEEKLATCLARVIANEFNGDLNSAKWKQFGRLAGFTNRKPQYVNQSGHFPFVLLEKAKKVSVSKPDKWFEKAELLKAEKEEKSKPIIPNSKNTNLNAIDFYEGYLLNLKKRFGSTIRKYGGDFDPSKADWMIGIKMVENGFNRIDIASAIESCSPNIHERKAGHVDHYINLTLDEIYKRVEISNE